ncbi:MAG: hypothetical protein M3367_02510 [Acidobacteriota bacterium]|nr:hypothetical protein [Acidobacteriota bacterium]
MDEKKLAKIKREIDSAKQGAGNLKHRDLANIAKTLGRVRSKSRTSEPTFVSTLLNTNVITIPDHARGLNKITALSILNQLEDDVNKFEEQIEERKKREIIYANSNYDN